MNIELEDYELAFLHDLTEVHVQNWRALSAYMKSRGNTNYDQRLFSATSANGYCALSYAIRAEIVEFIDTDLHAYREACNKTFGKDSFEHFFAMEPADKENFVIFRIADAKGIDMERCKALTAAGIIDQFIDMRSVKSYATITIHWKDGSTDKFKTKEAAKEFLELNPHRVPNYEKATGTLLIPRTVYDEVTEHISI